MAAMLDFLRRASREGCGGDLADDAARQDPMIEEASAAEDSRVAARDDEEITVFSSPVRDFELDLGDGEEILSSFCEGNELSFNYIPDKVVAAINAGGSSILDTSFGIDFVDDRFFSGGDVLRTAEDIVDAQEPSLYRTARYGEVTYALDGLESGDYYVDIHFAEIIFTNGPPGMRIFDVYIQDEKVVSDLDVYGRVGSNRPLILLNVRAAVDGGVLTLAFRGVVGNPTISAICVHRAPPLAKRTGRKPRPIYELALENCQKQNARRLTFCEQMRDKSRGAVTESEQRLEELRNECHQAWISVQESNRQAEKLRDELSVKSLTVDTLANAVETQVLELRDLKEKEMNEKTKLKLAVSDAQRKVEELRILYSLLSKDARDCICSFPDPHGMVSAVQALVNEQKELKKRLLDESQERKFLYNKLIEMKGNVRVFCRCRPLNASEASASSVSVVEFDSARENELVIRAGTNPKKLYKFDRVFTPEDDQPEVFADTSPVVVSVLDGYNVCIFAYGQTGTGKTFTMEGIPGNRGVNYRTLEELFRLSTVRKGEVNYEIKVSVLEVYNEQIRDLLTTPSQAGLAPKRLEIKQDADGGHRVPGLVEAEVHSMTEVWEVLQSGSAARAVGSTNANEHSSRSHCMLCVKVRGENMTTGECTRSKLWLVDLAGSERVAKSDVQGDRLKEAQNINKSLSALGDVIHALTTKSNHVPYRNSKLTHLLQDSLGGESKTLMFVQISPTEADVGETLCSLNFASRVRGVEMGPAKKQLDSSEFFKYKQMAEKAKQDVKTKDDSVRRLEDSLRTTESKLKVKEQLCQSLAEKVKDRDKVAAELELQLATEKKARLAAEVALKEKRLKADREGSWDRADRANAEEALEAAFKTAASFHPKENSYRQPLQERALENELKPLSKDEKAPKVLGENRALQNENIDPQNPDGLTSVLRKPPHARLKVVPSRFNSPPLMPMPRRTSLCGITRRTSLAPAPTKFVVETPSTQLKSSEVQEDIKTVQSIVQAESRTFQVEDSNVPSVAWKGIDVPGTLTRLRQHRRVHFSSPLMRSREKLMALKKETCDNLPETKQSSGTRMRRVSLVARSWNKHPGGAQRILSGRKGSMHQRERGWNKG
ncbi:kinesin-like protein KIN-14E [Selaginella moellendorffii]|uniref:kinesin-like protein KIN-14E n=1 Tax=Selaginella moellendorffii TaxID=88036 RepID=UPI000D1C37D1|nr:kinesin-like protein KIN-14E [Selaginella moellendorffii]|eukprot:XP_024533955.1 kinesin-like protein KIN-14E [Selaginella moellendorffii]